MKKKIGMLLLVLFLFNILVVCAEEDDLIASIDKPKVVLYKAFTGETLKFQSSVVVNNDNNFDVRITISPADIWEELVEVEESEFILEANDRREVFYTVTINEVKHHAGDILITFKNPNSNSKLSLIQRLVVDVKEVEIEDSEGVKNSKITGSVVGLSKSKVIIFSSTLVAMLFFVFLLAYLFRKTKKGIEIVPENASGNEFKDISEKEKSKRGRIKK